MKFFRINIKAILSFIVVSAFVLAFAAWYFDLPHSPVESVSHLHGKTAEEVLEQLGDPTYEDSFTMDQCVGELRITLFNTYPPDSPNNTSVKIRECTWEYPRYRLTVWFHQPKTKWIALDTCRYQQGVTF